MFKDEPKKGKLIVVSGPSGSGKGSIVDKLLDEDNVELSISCTTRPPRVHEKDGINYFFKKEDEFNNMIVSKSFLEHAKVFGCQYGTPKERVLQRLSAGKNVILEIDVQGAMQVKENYPDSVLIFISPPSEEELLDRLKKRGTETPVEIQTRFAKAKEELKFAAKYDYNVVNVVLDDAVNEVKEIIKNATK